VRRVAEGVHGDKFRWELPAADNVELTAIRRMTFQTLMSNATRKGHTTAAIILGYAIGFGPDELEARIGIKANTITQRKGRFERSHREEAA
jgi:hypothetical protein